MDGITSTDIRRLIGLYFPRLEFIVLSDTIYLPWEDDNELKNWVADHIVPWSLGQVFECEEHSLYMMATQRFEHAMAIKTVPVPAALRKNKALGLVWGSRFAGRNKNHFLVVGFTRERMFLVEPQNGKTWEPDDDKILFLFM